MSGDYEDKVFAVFFTISGILMIALLAAMVVSCWVLVLQ